MEIIEPERLNSYEDILDQINIEFEKSEKLKRDIEKQDDRILALKLSAVPTKHDICRIVVKAFNIVPDFVTLYSNNARPNYLGDFEKRSYYKYHLVEVHLPGSIIQKFTESEDSWKVQVNIVTANYTNTSTLDLINRQPLVVIIPIDWEMKEVAVNTYLFCETHDNFNVIELNSTVTNISHHFYSVKGPHDLFTTCTDRIIELAKLYLDTGYLNDTLNLDLWEKELKLNAIYVTTLNRNNFVSSLIKNAYHRLHLESFSPCVVEQSDTVEMFLSIDGRRFVLHFSKEGSLLRMKHDYRNMEYMRKFILQFTVYDEEKVQEKIKALVAKRDALYEGIGETYYLDLKDIVSLYSEMRKIFL